MGHERAGHSRVARGSALADLVHRPRGAAAAARRRQDLGRHAAEGRRHRARCRGGVPRVHVISYAQADSLLARGVHERRHRHARRQRHEGAAARGTERADVMARLWDKGLPLDERILRFTAGEDHSLGRAARRVRRARVDRARRMLDASEAAHRPPICNAICDGSRRARGRARRRRVVRSSSPTRTRTARSRRRLTERIGEAGGRVHLGRSRNDQVLVGAASVPARCRPGPRPSADRRR